MKKTLGLLVLLTGLSFAGCGSDSGSPPDVGVKRDTGSDVGSDVGADAAAPEDTASSADLASPLEAPAPDAPIARDTSVPLDLPVADVPIDFGGTIDLPPVIDSSGVERATVDSAVSESGGAGEAGSPATFVASLSGAQEVPPVVTAAMGSATFTLSADRTQLTFSVTHTVVGGTASHIHLAAAGENGAVIYPFTPFGATMTGTLAITTADADNLEQGKLYVNVHSATNPGGEIRGQILHPGDTLWVANLTGGQETPPVTSAGTGHGAVIMDATNANLRYHVVTTGLTLTGAHIHKGIATIAGAVIHPLTPLGATIDGTVATSGTDAQDLMDGLLYVNVHTAANPGGELRGQLMMPGEILYSASMSGANEVPAVTTTATGGAQFILGVTGTSLRYQAAFTGLTATASHIHTGAVGVNGPVLYPLTLTATGAAGTQAITAGDVTTLDAGGFYVNAHTSANPGGEIRGQIAKQ
jgi:trimeric autotransporter adhesin